MILKVTMITMMKYLFKLLFVVFSTFTLFACSPSHSLRLISAEKTAKDNGFDYKLVKGGDFWLTTFQRITDRSKPFVIYLEGDGDSFNKYGALNENPTPKYHFVLSLAALDRRSTLR